MTTSSLTDTSPTTLLSSPTGEATIARAVKCSANYLAVHRRAVHPLNLDPRRREVHLRLQPQAAGKMPTIRWSTSESAARWRHHLKGRCVRAGWMTPCSRRPTTCSRTPCRCSPRPDSQLRNVKNCQARAFHRMRSDKAPNSKVAVQHGRNPPQHED